MKISSEESGGNLEAIDGAFGHSADLYKDVLGVKSNASPEQIQRAYLDRRNELFKLLSNIDADEQDSITASHRFHAEQKMDAVVMAMRILGDPELRIQYDDMRHERLQGRISPPREPYNGMDEAEIPTTRPLKGKSRKTSSPRRISSHHRHGSAHRSSSSRRYNSSPRRTSSPGSRHHRSYKSPLDSSPSDEDFGLAKKNKKKKSRTVTPTERRKSSSRRRDRRGERSDYTSTTDEPEYSIEVTDEGTVLTESSRGTQGTLMEAQNGGLAHRVRDEVMGAVEDTATSFEQVFSVFTLREEDIRAVMNRIDKAHRQMQQSL